MTDYMRIFQGDGHTITTDKLVVTTALMGLAASVLLTFGPNFEKQIPSNPISAPQTIGSPPSSTVSATQFASYFGVSGKSGDLLDLVYIDQVISAQNQLDDTALLQSLADLMIATPPAMETQLSTVVTIALLKERGFETPLLSAPLKNATQTEISADIFKHSLPGIPQDKISRLLTQFDAMHTLHLTHFFDTTVLTKAEYHVAMAILRERGAI